MSKYIIKIVIRIVQYAFGEGNRQKTITAMRANFASLLLFYFAIYFFCCNPFSKWSTAAFSCASSPFKTASGSL